MDKSIKERVIIKYVDDTVLRMTHISHLIAVGETFLLLLDIQNGFFTQHSLNYINLFAELSLIIISLFVYSNLKYLSKIPELRMERKERIIIIYRIVIILAVLMFIFTDIYVRGKALGAYMVFLFVLQITPSYKSRVHWIQFSILGLTTVIEYMTFVALNLNTLYATLVIFLCFAISSEFLRKFFLRQLENYFLAEDSNMRYRRLSRQAIAALAGAVEAKDEYTKGHSQRVADYSAAIAEKMGYSEAKIREVSFIALMHDVGKIGVPDTVITKKDRLTEEEFEEIKKHPVKGYEILKDITELPGISEGARWHHERFDGKGYPDRLKGHDIPEIARIIAVADAYDAMTSNRSYRNAMPQEKVREQIEKNSGTQFDPKMAEIMLELMNEDLDYKMHE